jgi:hypothetical protein
MRGPVVRVFRSALAAVLLAVAAPISAHAEYRSIELAVRGMD